MRKNAERVNGKFKNKLEGLDSYASEVANTLADNYPAVDLIDVAWQFETQFRFEISRRIAREAAEQTK